MRNIIAVKVAPKIAQGVNTLCHRFNMGDGGSGSWAPGRPVQVSCRETLD